MDQTSYAIHLILTRVVPDLYINNLRCTHAFSNHCAIGTNPRASAARMVDLVHALESARIRECIVVHSMLSCDAVTEVPYNCTVSSKASPT